MRVSGVNGVSFVCLSVCLCVCLSLCADVADMCSAACFPGQCVCVSCVFSPYFIHDMRIHVHHITHAHSMYVRIYM